MEQAFKMKRNRVGKKELNFIQFDNIKDEDQLKKTCL